MDSDCRSMVKDGGELTWKVPQGLQTSRTGRTMLSSWSAPLSEPPKKEHLQIEVNKLQCCFQGLPEFASAGEETIITDAQANYH
jgi:hypothetical protein